MSRQPVRAAWAAALLLAVLLQAAGCASAAAAGRRAGCGGGRRLRQMGHSTPAPDGNSTIETVEVDVVSQECSMSQNVYFEATAPDVRVITQPDVNLQPSARTCCASCHDIPACSAFQWCPLQDGCAVPGASSTNVTFPYQGCQLLDLTAFLRSSVNTGEIKVSGPNVAFTTGTPLFFSVPKLSGYDVEVGRNFGGKFNYTCTGTLALNACVIVGTAQDLGAACDTDPLCLAFSFYPNGAAWDGNQSYGVLKGGPGVQLSSADTELNPNAAIYLKLEPMGQGGGGEEVAAASSDGDGDGNGTSTGTIVAAVVGSVAGVALIAGVALGFVWVRYRRLKAAAVSDVRKATPGRPGGEGGLTPAGSGPLADGSSGGETPVAAGAGAPGSGAGGLHSAPHSHPGGSAATSSPAKSAPHSNGLPLSEVELPGGAFLVAAPAGAAGQQQWQQQQQQQQQPQQQLGGASPFIALSPQQLGAPVEEELEVLDVSHSGSGSSDGSPWRRGAAPQSSPWQLVAAPAPAAAAQPGAAVAQQQVQQQQLANGSSGIVSGSSGMASGGSDLPLVVEVQRAVTGAEGGGRGDLPASLQQAATARELLEVFARMYSQRPAVDYAVVAQMLDQDADPGAVEAAEAADAAALQRVDAAALQARSSSRSRSPPVTGTASMGASPARSETAAQREATIAALVAAAEAHQPAAVAAPEAAAGAAGGAPGPALLPGSALLLQRQSLLPGMSNAEPSLEPVRPSEWSLQPEEVEICKRPDGSFWQLGTGAFGTCYKGLYHGQQLVAVKVLHRVEERRRGEEFEREVALLKTLRDRNIVQFIGACLEGPTPMLVTEFMEFGDLWRALPLKNAAGQRIFAWAKRGRRVLFDVAKGLYYLHQRRIVHLDLKSANILLSRHGTAKICDIGMARVLGNKEYLSMLSGMGTFAWSAPEVLSGKRCTEKVDLYSYGVVIWEVCTGDVPVRGEMRPLVAPHDCPQEVVDLHNRCISEHPEERPTAAELLTTLAPLL